MTGAVPTALERSLTYRGFSEAFRSAEGGVDLLDDALIPLPPENAAIEFVNAFDPAVCADACSLHASHYAKQGQAALFEELLRWHNHFGLKRTDAAVLPDHAAAELEFMHFLTYREHKTQINSKSVRALRRAERDFLERHLLPLADAIKANCSSPAARYKALSEELPRFLKRDMKFLCADSATRAPVNS